MAVPLGLRYASTMRQGRQDAVLLVEDDDELRTALAELLKLDGYRVREARNGAHALRVLRTRETRARSPFCST
jgi:DNA-binding NtrC family response regulator